MVQYLEEEESFSDHNKWQKLTCYNGTVGITMKTGNSIEVDVLEAAELCFAAQVRCHQVFRQCPHHAHRSHVISRGIFSMCGTENRPA